MKKISILIALRNEEKIILSCLENLKISINEFYEIEKNKQNFEVEILIGDDNSNDKSPKIVKYFIEKNQDVKYKYFEIIQNNLKGKANVIYQLINHSEGETIILLDADILVNQRWLKELVKIYYQSDEIKMVMGTTIPSFKNKVKRHQQQFFTTVQTIDWVFGQGILAIFSKLGFPQTAMGNNLIFDKKTYQKIGGYQKIIFSITEDVALFKAFQNYFKEKSKKHFFIHLFNSESLAFTEAEPTVKEWVLQRHRWFCGAWQFSNFVKKTILLLYLFRIIFVFLFLIGIILTGNIYLMLFFFFVLIINFLFIISFFIKLKIKLSVSILLQVFLFCLTESFFYSLVGIHFLKTKKVKWKEREF